MANKLEQQNPQFFELNGIALNDGYIYIGVNGSNPETNPIPIFLDGDLTTPIAQPLRTTGGYIYYNGNQVSIYFDESDYSITVKNSLNNLIYTNLSNIASSNTKSIDTIEDLATYTGTGVVIVKDINRGGAFVSKTTTDLDPNTGELYAVNGGTVFAKVGGGFWARQYSGAVNVKWFGAVGNGVTDDTTAIQSAIDFSKSNETLAFSVLGGGSVKIYFPAGVYNVNSSLNLNNNIGLQIEGDGNPTTMILFTGSNSVVLNWNSYANCVVRNIRFSAGTIDSNKTFTGQSTRDNICNKTYATSIGHTLIFENCSFTHFRTIHKFNAGNNQDNVSYINCETYSCVDCWDSSGNFQTINLKVSGGKHYYHSGKVFNNPSPSTLIENMDVIIPGTFLYGNEDNSCKGINVNKCYFETYQNIDSTSAPMFFNFISNKNQTIYFNGCYWSSTGGALLTGKTAFSASSGGTKIYFNNCVIECGGNMNLSTVAYASKYNSSVEFNNTVHNLNIVRSVISGNGNTVFDVIQDGKTSYLGDTAILNHSGISANYQGTRTIQDSKVSLLLNAYTFNAQTLSFSRIIPNLLTSSSFLVSEIEVVHWNNTTVNCTLTIYTDSAKTNKVYEVTLNGTNNNQIVKPFDLSSFSSKQLMTSTNNTLYIDVTSAGNVGYFSARLDIKLASALIR